MKKLKSMLYVFFVLFILNISFNQEQLSAQNTEINSDFLVGKILVTFDGFEGLFVDYLAGIEITLSELSSEVPNNDKFVVKSDLGGYFCCSLPLCSQHLDFYEILLPNGIKIPLEYKTFAMGSYDIMKEFGVNVNDIELKIIIDKDGNVIIDPGQKPEKGKTLDYILHSISMTSSEDPWYNILIKIKESYELKN